MVCGTPKTGVKGKAVDFAQEKRQNSTGARCGGDRNTEGKNTKGQGKPRKTKTLEK